jgi:glycosyltransferase involved in cell wall biosynthesis
MAVRLPVIASAVGGVQELVVPGETGFLVEPFDDVVRYAAALLDIYLNRVDVSRLVENAARLLRERHSWEAFARAIRETPGYVLAEAAERGVRRLAA